MDKWIKENKIATGIVVSLVLIITSAIITVSRNRDIQISPRAYNLPTATEVFRLRSECATLGQKILDNNTIGSALTQSQVSHYNPMTNRCYIQLTVQSADLGSGSYFSNTLYDGQTGDILASATQQKGKKEYGNIFNGPTKITVPNPSETTFQSTNDYINEIMTDDWKQ